MEEADLAAVLAKAEVDLEVAGKRRFGRRGGLSKVEADLAKMEIRDSGKEETAVL